MNRSSYFKEISNQYGLNDQSKIVKVVEEIDIFIHNLSPLLRFVFSIYFLILKIFPSYLNSKKVINYLPKVIGLKLLHEFCTNIFLMFYHDEF
jgi:hypothetical protein